MAYTKNVAMRVAQFGATCNSLDPGGVLTPLNDCVINDKELWDEIMGETPLKRWARPEEIAEWAFPYYDKFVLYRPKYPRRWRRIYKL